MTEDRHGEGESPEERALRELLHRAVAGLHPEPDALPRIRRAVPARRARHRQAWTCAALVAAVLAVALPTLHGLPGLQLSDGSAPGAAGATAGGRPVLAASRRPTPVLPGPGDADATASAGALSPAQPSGSASSAAPAGGASAAPSGSAPPCARADLGPGTAQLGTPDAAGRRYGVFTVANVSGRACLLTDPGTVTVSGGAGPVAVVDHRAGDPADGLPDPATAPSPLVLAAAGGYRLSFAWVPDTLCPATASPGAGAAGPSADPRSSGGAAAPPSADPSPGAPGSGAPSPGEQGGPQIAAASPAAQASAAPTATAAATAGPSASLSADPGQQPASADPSGTLVVDHWPLGTGPDAVALRIEGVCGAGTLYRAQPQPQPGS